MDYREQAERLWSSLLDLGPRRLAALAIVGMTVFTVVGLGAWYLSRPDLETLYTGLSGDDVGRIGGALTEAGIPFDVSADGKAVLVRFGQTARARMLLAEKGLPRSSSAGYELFDNLGSLGLTSFMQEVTRVRVLEGEIARTIQSIKGVKAARVHIVMPDPGSFRRSQQPPSASVVIRTDGVDQFASAQAIRHLVKSAVPGLGIDQVTVLSTDGTLLASGDDAASATSGRLVGLEKSVSSEIQDSIRRTLTPYLGLGNFQVSVAARLNTDKKQVSETIIDPESRVERSVRSVRDKSTTQNTSSKQAVSVQQTLPQPAGNEGSGNQSNEESDRREEQTNYEFNSKTISTVSDGYGVEALSVAVVINRSRLLETLGKDAKPEQVTTQLGEIEQLVASAAGADAARGDRVKVTAVDFFSDGQPMEPVPSLGILDQLIAQFGSIINALTILIVAVLVIWFGLKPAMRAILERREENAATGQRVQARIGGNAASAAGAHALVAGAEGDESLITDLKSKMRRLPQKKLEQMVEFDSEQAAAILKQWIRQAKAS
ncbi:MAG: flagellar basal-body MS-ring/collar protein FliF [Parvibaculaceae bacterium]